MPDVRQQVEAELRLELTEEEVETVKALIEDWDLISSPAAKADFDKLVALSKRLGMDYYNNRG